MVFLTILLYLFNVGTMFLQIIKKINIKFMKEEEIKIRISPTLKKDFQNVCEAEQTTMSNKISAFVFDEVKSKKPVKQTYRKQLIRFDVRTTDGRLYKRDELLKTVFDNDGFEQTELDRLNKNKLYGQFGHPDTANLIHHYNATHSISNLAINGDWLEGDVTILNNSIIPILDNVVFRLRAYGELGKDKVIKNLEIIGFDAILKSEDTFK